MTDYYSPLRYPGGKSKLYPMVKSILVSNNLLGGTYVEPFAGGAGLALKLLLNNDVRRIVLNDIDPAIYYFWKAILNESDRFCNAIDKVNITIDEWKKQKRIFKEGNINNEFEFAFSVFFLNRTNVSGVLKGGVIGGINQNGKYKISARFNKNTLKERIKSIAKRKNDIILFNLDAKNLISQGYLSRLYKVFIFFDPPYVKKGSQLYLNSFKQQDHRALFECIKKCKKKWVLTYDYNEYIGTLYSEFNYKLIPVNYSVRNKTKEKEYMFFSRNLNIPSILFNGGYNMKNTNCCRFCSIQKGNQEFPLIDTPIIEDDNYYLLASLGAMVEGWSLVIPKCHTYSMKSYYNNEGFHQFTNKCISLVKSTYRINKVIVFEHGANHSGSLTACGTNHSHIHIVPINDSLLDLISAEYSFNKIPISRIEESIKDSEYLLYAEVNEQFEKSDFYIHILEKPISQFFRRIIADKLGCPEQYNYKENYNLEISSNTVKALQKEVKNE